MAVNALKGFGWFLTGMVVAPTCYLVTSQVAAERTRVEAVERAILQARKDIRTLETEFDTRANLAQLERWNGDVLRFTAPTPAQFLKSDTVLAELSPLDGANADNRYAALIPQGVPEAAAEAVHTVESGKGSVKATIKANDVAAVATGAAHTVAKAAKGQAVAMLDSKLLNDSSFGDLMKGVRAEASGAR